MKSGLSSKSIMTLRNWAYFLKLFKKPLEVSLAKSIIDKSVIS